MLKVFHNDIHGTMHIPLAVISANLANCYDAVQHGVSCIALRAFGVPQLAMSVILTCLQTIFFWLRTAFGFSSNPFHGHGTTDNPFSGLAQRSQFAPSTFQAVSTLMINSYKSMGNRCIYVSLVTVTIFAFSVILYVDDTNLLMRARCQQHPTRRSLT